MARCAALRFGEETHAVVVEECVQDDARSVVEVGDHPDEAPPGTQPSSQLSVRSVRSIRSYSPRGRSLLSWSTPSLQALGSPVRASAMRRIQGSIIAQRRAR
ncbi:hypothetical protein IQ62_28520 [Streptomyces scabiei]|nr:hypothetical protein IQ62_28520 [Streptomyces scabiei]